MDVIVSHGLNKVFVADLRIHEGKKKFFLMHEEW